MRKRMYFIPAGFILFILFFTVFGERGLLRIFHLKKDRQELQMKAEQLRAENERMKREVEALKGDRRYLESIARKDFGLVRPNEVIYQFPAAVANRQAPQSVGSDGPAGTPLAGEPAPDKQ